MAAYNQRQAGKHAEEQACQFLQAKGFALIQRNYTCRYGEIDLIMRDKNDIVFIEVRSRHRNDYGNALESINHAKLTRLIKTATHFLQKKRWLNTVSSRFDIIAIHPVEGKMRTDWIKNAFSVD